MILLSFIDDKILVVFILIIFELIHDDRAC